MSIIVEFQAENFKRLKAVRIAPKGRLVAISGANKQGKSSILDGIAAAIGGSSAVPDNPIRNGADTGWVQVDLGDKIVRRRFRRGAAGKPVTQTLTVETKDGAVLKSPQAVLNSLFADVSFDAGSFLRLKADAQTDLCKRFVVGFDFAAADRKIAEAREQRTVVGRKHKELTAAAEAISVPDGLPESVIDESALLNQVLTASTFNAEVERERADRERAKGLLSGMLLQVDQHRAEIERLKQLVADLQAKISAEDSRLSSLPELAALVDVSVVGKSIEDARRINAGIAKRSERASRLSLAESQGFQYDELTATIEDATAAKRAAIERAEMPVPGLAFDDSGVTLNGVPFDQASQAERIGVAVSIGMALNPTLRVIRISDGSLLDSASMAIVADLAEQHDFQVWVERVDESGRVGFVIEDGEVVTTNVEVA